MKLTRISPQSVKNIATILWLQKYKDKFLGSFNLEDTPEFGKRIAQAQLEACEEEAQEKVKEIFEEIEKHSHPMNTNMYGISLGKDWWQALKQKYLEEN